MITYVFSLILTANPNSARFKSGATNGDYAVARLDLAEQTLTITQYLKNGTVVTVARPQKLDLSYGGMSGDPYLTLAKDGSLLIHSDNMAIGRSRYRSALAVRFVRGKFLVTKSIYYSFDTLEPSRTASCEWDFTKKSGVVNGKQTTIDRPLLDVEAFDAREDRPICPAETSSETSETE